MSVVELSAKHEPSATASRSVSSDGPSVAPCTAGPVVELAVLDSLAAARPAWQALEAAGAIGTAFQRHAWVEAWQRHAGAAEGARPLVVIGRDRTGAPAFLWPFVVSRGLLSIARFPGGNHSGLNIGLWRPDAAAAMTGAMVRDLLVRTGRRHGIDAFALVRQPRRWRGLDNPFARLPSQPSVDDVLVVTFPDGGTAEDAVKATLTRDMRGRLRTKERKLEKLDGYGYRRVTTRADADRVLDAFLAQKAAHFAAQGIRNVFADLGVADFLRAACHDGLADGRPGIELHALEGGGEVIAVMGGVCDQYRFSCMFNAYTTSENGRWSPGLILIGHILRDCAERGVASFDLGPGAAPYKTFFCREPEGLVDSLVPVSLAGRAAALGLAGFAATKRRAKESPLVMRLVQRLRRGAAAGAG
ncbi:GNAT family N-acetyltransferase [Rhodoplanes azumiensis]|uniref:GNAT family N-acetyltransferase n=1 Tax=Rhodoplanes azumiensis TaxID=1897628 RepID=A0ABW5AJL4_9BRAD